MVCAQTRARISHARVSLSLPVLLLFADRSYRKSNFDPHPEDRPLIVQFCGHDPALLLASAKYVEKECDAIDLNLVRWERDRRERLMGKKQGYRGGALDLSHWLTWNARRERAGWGGGVLWGAIQSSAKRQGRKSVGSGPRCVYASGSVRPRLPLERFDNRPLFVSCVCLRFFCSLYLPRKIPPKQCTRVPTLCTPGGRQGCPQGIARKGRYGAFLLEEWSLLRDIVSTLTE